MPILSLPIVTNSFPPQSHYLPRAAERRGKQTLQALVEVVPPKEVYVHEVVPEKEAPAHVVKQDRGHRPDPAPLREWQPLAGLGRAERRIIEIKKVAAAMMP